MSANQNEKRKGLKSPVTVFFIVAILCVVAFLIVALVNTCSTDHQIDKQQQVEKIIAE